VRLYSLPLAASVCCLSPTERGSDTICAVCFLWHAAEFVEFSQDQVIKTYAGDSGEASPAPVPAPAAAMAPPPSKITYKKMAPTKEMKDSNGKKATAFMQKLAQGEKLVNRIVIEEGFEWTTGVKPHLPGCPEHCPATHFGFIAAGQVRLHKVPVPPFVAQSVPAALRLV